MRGVSLVSWLILAALACKNEDTADSSSTDWPAGIHILDGVDPELPIDDLAPLGDIIGDAGYVALGETVHASGGYYQAKHRAIRYLVEERGFRSVAFETSWTAAGLVGDYVADGSGDAEEAVTEGLFPVWASEEVLALVEWMRAWNVEHPSDPVSFWGWDIQQPWDDAPALTAFVETQLPEQAEELAAGIARCHGVAYASYAAWWLDPAAGDVSSDDDAACREALDSLEALMSEQEPALISAIGEEVLERTHLHRISLVGWQETLTSSTPTEAYAARDEAMAEVFLRLAALEHPGERVVMWAANWHIAWHTEEMVHAVYPAPNMGGHLEVALGVDYLPIALAAFDVEVSPFELSGWVTDPELPVYSDSVEMMLHELDASPLLVDLAFPDSDEPFFEPGEVYRIGTSDVGMFFLVPAEHYRALIFLEESPEMNPLGSH